MGFLAVAPAIYIGQQLAQGLALRQVPQLLETGGRRESLRRRQLRGFQGQPTQQDRNAVEDRRQAEIGDIGGVGDRADHREHSPGDGHEAAW